MRQLLFISIVLGFCFYGRAGVKDNLAEINLGLIKDIKTANDFTKKDSSIRIRASFEFQNIDKKAFAKAPEYRSQLTFLFLINALRVAAARKPITEISQSWGAMLRALTETKTEVLAPPPEWDVWTEKIMLNSGIESWHDLITRFQENIMSLEKIQSPLRKFLARSCAIYYSYGQVGLASQCVNKLTVKVPLPLTDPIVIRQHFYYQLSLIEEGNFPKIQEFIDKFSQPNTLNRLYHRDFQIGALHFLKKDARLAIQSMKKVITEKSGETPELETLRLNALLNVARYHIYLNEMTEAEKIFPSLETSKSFSEQDIIFKYYSLKTYYFLKKNELAKAKDELSKIQEKYRFTHQYERVSYFAALCTLQALTKSPSSSEICQKKIEEYRSFKKLPGLSTMVQASLEALFASEVKSPAAKINSVLAQKLKNRPDLEMFLILLQKRQLI